MNPHISLHVLGTVLIKVATMMHCKQTSGGSAGEARIGVGVRSERLYCVRGTREEMSGARRAGGFLASRSQLR